MPDRREFLLGLLALPSLTVVSLADSGQEPREFLPGDLVDYAGPRNGRGFVGARLVAAVHGKVVLTHTNTYGPSRLLQEFAAHDLRLFEGLPGNRVDNPSGG